jgi:hypothetical protein
MALRQVSPAASRGVFIAPFRSEQGWTMLYATTADGRLAAPMVEVPAYEDVDHECFDNPWKLATDRLWDAVRSAEPRRPVLRLIR